MLADLFPIGPTGVENQAAAPPTEADDEERMSSMLEALTSELKSTKTISEPDGNVPRPGSHYPRYRVDADLPERARPFYETAAKVVGISVSTLVRAVFHTELKMDKWQDEQRRLEYYGEPMDMEFTGDEEIEGDDG